jgi:hypothetical protein
MKPTPANPISSMAHVEGSGTAAIVSVPDVICPENGQISAQLVVPKKPLTIEAPDPAKRVEKSAVTMPAPVTVSVGEFVTVIVPVSEELVNGVTWLLV